MFFAFLFVFYRQKTCFPPKRGHFLFIFSVSLSFSLAFFGPPPFLPFLFLCLSLVLFFLPSFLFFIFSFWFLLFIFVWFASWFKMFCCFCFSACCLVLFWIIMFDLFLLCILFSGCCCFLLFLLCYFVVFWFLETCQKTSLNKNGNWKNSKNEKCTKNGHFDKSC